MATKRKPEKSKKKRTVVKAAKRKAVKPSPEEVLEERKVVLRDAKTNLKDAEHYLRETERECNYAQKAVEKAAKAVEKAEDGLSKAKAQMSGKPVARATAAPVRGRRKRHDEEE